MKEKEYRDARESSGTSLWSRLREKGSPREEAPSASQALVDFASENWRLLRTVERLVRDMDPFEADRFLNQFMWYQRKVQAVLDEAELSVVDLTGRPYNTGMAVSPLNLDDFPNRPDAVFTVAQMVEPIVMEKGRVRKTGTVMLGEEMDAE